MSYREIVWEYLKKNGPVTSKKIEQLTGTVCSHSVIRDIRKKYGYDILGFEDIRKVKKVVVDGREIRQSKVYRKWFLQKLGA